MQDKRNLQACIINVQRFSIHDGPGIRTTVFMKGCNLRCLWCHNPESQSFIPQRMFFPHKCVNCGACRRVCDKAFSTECDASGRCVEECRYGAREISGKNVDPESLFLEIERDKDFYDTSGGGVTFSGGEPLLQYEFLKHMLMRCKENGIHTAIETAGNVEWSQLETLLLYLDLILYDIKAIEEEKHYEIAGVSNRHILENGKKLMVHARDRLLFRMPYVPGYNDTEFEKIVAYVQGSPLEIMPYHSIGMGKYEALGREYLLKDVKPPAVEEIRRMTQRYPNVFCEENMV